MLFNDNNQGLDNQVFLYGILILLLFGAIILSGAILLPLIWMGALILLMAKRNWIHGLITFLICLIFWAFCYRYSTFSDYPISEWYDIAHFYLMEFLGGEPGQSRLSRVPNILAHLSLCLLPFGFGFWAWLVARNNGHQKLIGFFRSLFIQGRDFSKLRKRAQGKAFLGVDKNSGVSVLLSEDMRLRHTQVLGATGYGKTESVLKSLINNDIQQGRGLMLIDGKGDVSLRDQIFMAAHHHGRFNDVCYFNYSDLTRGMTYNPLLNGSATEVRDRIIDALDWSEEYYKKCASSALLLALQTFEFRKQKTTLEKIVNFLMNPKAFPGEIPSELDALYKDFRENHAKRLPEIKGLVTDLNNLILSGSGRFLNDENPDVDLFQAIREKRIVILQVSTLDYGITARSFGRLVVQDLKSVCGMINRRPTFPRNLFSVYIDEFESFAHESFNELLSKARSAGIGITILHQSMGDLEKIGPFFQKQITENTNNKIILRVNDEETVEYFANMAGTKQTTRMTHQVEEDFFSTHKTGMGSRRDVEEFNVHPNVIRNLRIGEAVVMIRNTGKSHVTKLDRPGSYESSIDYVEILREQARQQVTNSKPNKAASSRVQPLSAEIF